MRSGVEAAAYASELRRIMVFIGVTHGVMADAHLRFDVNVSVGNSSLMMQRRDLQDRKLCSTIGTLFLC
jgi:Asp-tRNA(Asn)/Glu-tRNA(Gln) amidotransferase B subunit